MAHYLRLQLSRFLLGLPHSIVIDVGAWYSGLFSVPCARYHRLQHSGFLLGIPYSVVIDVGVWCSGIFECALWPTTSDFSSQGFCQG